MRWCPNELVGPVLESRRGPRLVLSDECADGRNTQIVCFCQDGELLDLAGMCSSILSRCRLLAVNSWVTGYGEVIPC
jgi:hypothetical protein